MPTPGIAQSVRSELPKSYMPAEVEGKIRARWEASGAFHALPNNNCPSYCIIIPPPNVTAALHLGHAFNNTLQDILIRYHRMQGFNTLWMPGTDHAGIATQTVVEKRLLSEGTKRTDLSREDFVARVQDWKDEYEQTIIGQLREMGCSCDWERTRFTMDAMCAKAVREAFFQLFKDGLIYRGKRLVNWDPVTLTALADDEVEMQEVDGHFWYLKYPVVDDEGKDIGEFVTVATTRPETMLGDTAVAVNPHDEVRKQFIGKSVRLPLVGRIIPIIGDDYVVVPDPDSSDAKAQYASGFLKVTPAHDPNDWLIGLRHDLPVINVMAPDASISAQHGWDDCSQECQPILGLSRDEARTAIINWFRDHNLLEATKEYRHSVGHSYRSHVPVEPYLSDQWYVKVSDDRLVGEAQRALSDDQFEGAKPPLSSPAQNSSGDGELTFFPARYAKTYQAWHENLRDWCISRQLWWGHQIPVWSKEGQLSTKLTEKLSQSPKAEIQIDEPRNLAYVCLLSDDSLLITALESEGFTRDPDVLDTWFSSALWPISTMGWPEPKEFPETEGLLETFNPTAVLSTGRDIITLWVSRMVMFNRYFNHGKVPFRHVYIHPMIQDGHGQRMSKSLGNGVDPRDIIHSHGADSLRYTLAQMATTTQDCRVPVNMMCPHCEHGFHPKETTSPTGYRVAAPDQTCPDCGKSCVSGYGVASNQTSATDQSPLARNTSAKFDRGRNFANKVWNATRFALSNLSASDEGDGPSEIDRENLALVDRWILSRLNMTTRSVESAIGEYQFNAYAEIMEHFIWGDFCDWYLEAIKPTVKTDPGQQQVLLAVLNATLRLLHPICPFVTETLWPHVEGAGRVDACGIDLPGSDLLATASWPVFADDLSDPDAEESFSLVQGLVEAIRRLRSERKVNPRKQIKLAAPREIRERLLDSKVIIKTLAGLESLEELADRPTDAVIFTHEGFEFALYNLMDQSDVDAERARLEKEIVSYENKMHSLRSRLANEGYVNKAPAEKVQETRDQLAEAESALGNARNGLKSLDTPL